MQDAGSLSKHLVYEICSYYLPLSKFTFTFPRYLIIQQLPSMLLQM